MGSQVIRWLHVSDFHTGKDGYGQDVTYLPLNTVSRCNYGIETSIFDFTRQATI